MGKRTNKTQRSEAKRPAATNGVISADKELMKSLQPTVTMDFLSNVINFIADPVFVKDNQYRFVIANDAFCEILGIDRENILGKTLGESLPEDQMDVFLKVDRKVLDSGQEITNEESLTGKDGEILTIITKKTRYVDENGDKFLIGVIRNITDSKKEEDALKASEEKYRTLIENAVDQIFMIDRQYRYLSVNKAFCDSLNKKADQIMGQTIDDIHSPVISSAFKKNIDRLFSEGKTITGIEEKVVIADDQTIDIDTSLIPIKDEHGQVTAILGMVRDITERKQAEDAQIESKRKYHDLVNLLPTIVFEIDARTGNFTYVNEAAYRATGYSPADIAKGLAALQLFVPGDRPRATEDIRKILTGEIPQGQELEYKLQRRDGSTFPVVMYTSRVVSDGRSVGFRGVCVDLTSVRKAEATLAKEREKYHRIFETSNDALMILMTAEEFIDCNDATLKMFGCKTREEFLRKNLAQISPPTQADGSLSKDAANERIATAFKNGSNFFEWIHRCADGTDFPATILLTSFELDDRKALQATVRNVTELKEGEARVQALDMLKNNFIQTVSHQLRTPLSAVRWILEELMSKQVKPMTEEQQDMIRLAAQANDNVIVSIGDLILAMDIEQGRMRLDKKPAIFEDIVRSVGLSLQSRFDLKAMKHIHDFPDDQGTPVNIDIDRIKEVISRLKDNAIDYTPEGGKTTTRITVADGKVRYELTDTGIGIPESEQTLIFDRFFRGSNAVIEKPNGVGLGLYIIRNIIEAHGGKIGLTSKENKGSTFWFELPLADVGGVDRTTATPDDERPVTPTYKSGIKVYK